MNDRELLELADLAEQRVLGWIDGGLVPVDRAHGVSDIVALLRDRVRQCQRDHGERERRKRQR